MNNHTSELMIKRIQSKYERILHLYQGVPLAALWEPVMPDEWSVKDTVAHLAAWVWRCAFLLGQSREINGLLRTTPDRAALNEEFYQERNSWDWTRVEIDFRRAHWTLFDTIRTLPADRLSDPIVQKTIARETWEHYDEHLPDLENWYTELMSQQVMMT